MRSLHRWSSVQPLASLAKRTLEEVGKAIALDIYKSILRPVLFSARKADPEGLHQQTIRVLRGWQLQRNRLPVSWMLSGIERVCCFQDERLTQTLWGLKFANPFGLAAGFDKNAEAAGIWGVFGFGYAELGTITRYPQPGNPRPRLFRLTADRAVLNRMGFNNQGCVAVSQHLEKLASQELLTPRTPLGINLGKSKITPLAEAATDYVASFRQLRQWGDYFVVNVSSPNTPGLRSLQQAEQLSQILDALQQENQGEKPILVKIAPDLTWEAVAQVLDLAKTHQLAGIVATNTTISREGLKTERIARTGNRVQAEAGGLSGLPLRDRATEIIRFIWQQTEGQLPIIGVGGIFTAEDAWEKITAGASLIQVYTGWIYEGPLMARRVLKGLSQKLSAQGLTSLSEAVGRGHVPRLTRQPY